MVRSASTERRGGRGRGASPLRIDGRSSSLVWEGRREGGEEVEKARPHDETVGERRGGRWTGASPPRSDGRSSSL